MHKYDLLICGGGTAGVSAGYIASKYGIKTLIVEKNIHLGGSITSALVIPVMKSNSKNINCEFYDDFINEMKEYNAQVTYTDGNSGWFNPELAKIALDSMLKKVGCDVLYDSEVKSANYFDNHVNYVEICSKVLSIHIESLYYLDTTGDGNFSTILKNKILDNNSTRQPLTLRFNVSGINLEIFADWITNLDKDRNVTTSSLIDGQIHMSTAYTWDSDKNWALRPIFDKAVLNGDLKDTDSAYFQLFTIPGMPNTISLNCPRIAADADIDPLNPFEFSRAMIIAREQIWRIYLFMKKYFPGFENSYISNIADMAGIRESRRVEGQYIYTTDDILSGKTYSNPVLHGDYPIDIHSYKKNYSTLEEKRIDYELPITALKLKDFDNVFVAGRCLSADFKAQAALRVQKSCFSMGEAVAKHIATILR